MHDAMNAPLAPPTVHLVDDDPQVARALARMLREHGFRTTAFDSAEAFLAQCDTSAPGCLVLDVNLPGLDGLALQRQLAEGGRPLPIVFLTGHGDIPMSVKAVKAGAVDFLTKPVAADVLVAAVRAGVAQDARSREARAESAARRKRLASLTAREREVLAGLVAGKLNKQIAADLGIVEPTVKFHRARIMERMQVHTIAELMHVVARLE
jgi:FixJ family two-component response regulator